MIKSTKTFLLLAVYLTSVLVGADVSHLLGVNKHGAPRLTLNPGPNDNGYFYDEPASDDVFAGYPAYTGPKLVSNILTRNLHT